MIEDDILTLSQRHGQPLDRLEADIWVGVDARINARRMSRAVFSCQAAVLAIALMASVSAGTRAAMADNPNPRLGAFSTRADLTPSTRLLGH